MNEIDEEDEEESGNGIMTLDGVSFMVVVDLAIYGVILLALALVGVI